MYRDLLIESMNYYQNNKGLIIIAYVIMTNHVHVIWKARHGNLSDLVRDYKKRTARLIIRDVRANLRESRRKWLTRIFHEHALTNKRSADWQLWTRENHAVDMSNPRWLRQRIHYIHKNPVKAGWVLKEYHYLYSSASNYYCGHGLVDVNVSC